MRSLVMSVFLFTSALASALGQAFVRKSSRPIRMAAVANLISTSAIWRPAVGVELHYRCNCRGHCGSFVLDRRL